MTTTSQPHSEMESIVCVENWYICIMLSCSRTFVWIWWYRRLTPKTYHDSLFNTSARNTTTPLTSMAEERDDKRIENFSKCHNIFVARAHLFSVSCYIGCAAFKCAYSSGWRYGCVYGWFYMGFLFATKCTCANEIRKRFDRRWQTCAFPVDKMHF